VFEQSTNSSTLLVSQTKSQPLGRIHIPRDDRSHVNLPPPNVPKLPASAKLDKSEVGSHANNLDAPVHSAIRIRQSHFKVGPNAVLGGNASASYGFSERARKNSLFACKFVIRYEELNGTLTGVH
jgi:hypothetical protein